MSLDELQALMEQVRAEAEFEVILLTDLEGHIIAAARSDEATPDTLGALLDVAARIAARAEDRERLATAGESVFFDWEGRQIICRWFTVADQRPRLLVILVPHGKTYKRAASQLAKDAKRLLGG